MNSNNLVKFAGIGLVSVALSACGGGSGGTSESTDSTQTTSGAVTGFGSVFVNGVEFETDGSVITVEGEPASEDDLDVGMMVTVRGRHDGSRGNAMEIHADDEIEGVVLSNGTSGGTGEMNVMGQTVRVKATTNFESKLAGITSVDEVVAGHVVEVHGSSDGSGLIVATRIELKAEDLSSYLAMHDAIEVKGIVSDLDNVEAGLPMAFRIGELVVDYSGAIIDDDTVLANGLFVEVKSQQPLANGVLVASKVEAENDGEMGHHDDDADENDEFEIKGAITTAFDGEGFAVDGTRFLIADGTEFEHGGTDQLQVGTVVEVEGRYNDQGMLVAHEVEFEDAGDSEIEGVIDAIESTGTNTGTITLQSGTMVHVDNETIMKDDRDDGMMPVERFNLTHLAVGDFVEVHGVSVGTNEVRAIKLERDDRD